MEIVDALCFEREHTEEKLDCVQPIPKFLSSEEAKQLISEILVPYDKSTEDKVKAVEEVATLEKKKLLDLHAI